MDKLRVPAPDKPLPQDDTQISFELWIGLVLAVLVIFFGWLLWIHPQVTDPPDEPYGDVEDDEERRALQDRAEFAELAERNRLESVDWRDDPEWTLRALEVAPRETTEAVCREYAADLATGQLAPAKNRALLRLASRRALDAPWQCLIDRYLDDGLVEGRSLHDEIASFWEDIQSLDQHGAIMERVVAGFHQAGRSLDSPRLERWVQRCALTLDYEAALRCQHWLADNAPAYGVDLLEMLIDYVGATPPDIEDLEMAVEALTYFVRYGQPNGWFVDDPDYDQQFQVGALFMLCRFINAPDDEVRQWAVDGLGQAAGVSRRPTNPNMEYRWRKACRYAFGDREEPPARVPALAVIVMEDDQETPEYGLDAVKQHRLCEPLPNQPIWSCGLRQWTGQSGESIQKLMGHHFARTGYIEWYEEEALETLEGD